MFHLRGELLALSGSDLGQTDLLYWSYSTFLVTRGHTEGSGRCIGINLAYLYVNKPVEVLSTHLRHASLILCTLFSSNRPVYETLPMSLSKKGEQTRHS